MSPEPDLHLTPMASSRGRRMAGWLTRPRGLTSHQLPERLRWLARPLGFRWMVRPWWREPPAEVRRRRLRLVLTGPIGTLLGLIFGILVATELDLPLLPFIAGCAFTGFSLMYVLGNLESWTRVTAHAQTGIPSALVWVAADVIGGGTLGWIMSTVLDTGAATLFATGATIFVAYSFIASNIFWGTWIEDLVHLFSGGYTAAPSWDYSRQHRLAAQGRVDEALAAFEEVSLERGGHPDPLLNAAWMLRDLGQHEEAVQWYRRAFEAPRLDARRASIFVRQIVDAWATELADPEGAIPDLEALVDRYPESEEVAWARDRLEALRG